MVGVVGREKEEEVNEERRGMGFHVQRLCEIAKPVAVLKRLKGTATLNSCGGWT